MCSPQDAARPFRPRWERERDTGNVFLPQTAVSLTGAEVTSYTSDPLYNFASSGLILAPTSQSLPDLSSPYTSAVTSPQNQATKLSVDIAGQETVVEFLTAMSSDPATRVLGGRLCVSVRSAASTSRRNPI